jgi:hypothetical protein
MNNDVTMITFAECDNEAVLLARVLRANKSFRAAFTLLRQEGLLVPGTESQWLAATCLFEAGDTEGALDVIGEDDGDRVCVWHSSNVGARIACLRGSIYGMNVM